MDTLRRNRVLVQVRISARERARWLHAATLEDVRLGELVREAVRTHVRELERLRLLGDRGPIAPAPSVAS
jgi:hypothetical protein